MPSLVVALVNIWINFTSPETRMVVLLETEGHTIISSFVCTKHRNVMEGWKDRGTDLPWLLQRSALQAMWMGHDVKKRPMKTWK